MTAQNGLACNFYWGQQRQQQLPAPVLRQRQPVQHRLARQQLRQHRPVRQRQLVQQVRVVQRVQRQRYNIWQKHIFQN